MEKITLLVGKNPPRKPRKTKTHQQQNNFKRNNVLLIEHTTLHLKLYTRTTTEIMISEKNKLTKKKLNNKNVKTHNHKNFMSAHLGSDFMYKHNSR